MYNTNCDIRFKTTTFKSSFCDYSYAYMLLKGTIIISEAGDDAEARQTDERNKGVIFEILLHLLIIKVK